MTQPAVPPAALAAALEMIDVRRWGVRAQIVAVAARATMLEPEGAKLPYRKIAAATGCNERYAHQLLRALVRERVLIRVAAGKRGRGTRYRINPNVLGWRAVPWRVDRELADHRVAALVLLRGPKSEDLPRSHRAANGEDLPRSHRAASESAILPRIEGVGAANGARLAAPKERGKSIYGAAPHSFSPRDRSLSQPDRERAVVIGAVAERTGYDAVGRCADDIARLVDRYGEDRCLDVIAEIDPTGMMAPMFVKAMQRRLVEDGGAQSTPLRERAERRQAEADLERERLQLHQDHEHWTKMAAEHPGEAVYRDELARCENALAALEQGAAVG